MTPIEPVVVIISHYDLTGLLAEWKIKDDSIVTHLRKQMLSMTKRILGDIQQAPIQTVLLASTLILISAIILHFGIEKPGLKLRNRILNEK